jgi:ferritin-like metal-binding protein YciE
MPITAPRELFLHELGDVYDAEKRIETMLADLVKECSDRDAVTALKDHLQETHQQIQNIEQCFTVLGAKPHRQECQVVEGIKKEHDAFVRGKPTDEMLMLFDLAGTAKTEHYEIAAYRTLIDQCKLMGQQDCVDLLSQNLRQEEAMAQRVEMISHRLSDQVITQLGGFDQPGQQYTPGV